MRVLPVLPRLVPDIRVFDMPDGLGFQFHGVRVPVLVRGKLASAVLPWLLPLLDGKRSTQDIVESRPATVSGDDVVKVLLTLQTKGLLVDAQPQAPLVSALDARQDPALERQLLFWGRNVGLTYANRSGAEAQHKLMTSRVVLVSDGMFGASVCDLLLRQGIGRIDVIEWSHQRLAQTIFSERAVREAVTVQCAERSNPDDLAVRLEDLAQQADLVVTALRSAPSVVFEAINRICISAERSWLRGHDDGAWIEVGPCVSPGSSGCYVCMRLRQVSVLEHAVEDELYQRHLLEHRESQGLVGESIVMATLGASLLCAEVMRVLTLLALPALQGTVVRVSFDGRIERNTFKRVPRCPACFRGEVTSTLEASGVASTP